MGGNLGGNKSDRVKAESTLGFHQMGLSLGDVHVNSIIQTSVEKHLASCGQKQMFTRDTAPSLSLDPI